MLRSTALLAAVSVATALLSANPAQAADSKGLALIKKSDCQACHAAKKSEPKKMGPSYQEIAAKYKGKKVMDKLADKVIKGGSGSFGAIPMNPHPQISKADAKAMVTYILTGK